MPRKILLSFLGTNNYEPVSYYIERKAEQAPIEKYVQKTILNYLAGSFGPDDQAYIFLTDEARAANWKNDGHFDYKKKENISNIGLEQQITSKSYSFSIRPESVNGESEPEAIWETFERVYDCIQTGDEVYLDITHSWRYLPMLGMTLLNYAKVLKNINVVAIYYGAFEHLGTVHEVKSLPMDERPVPILNLVSFSELQDWTIAADDFVQDGNPTRLAALTKRNLSGILRESKGQDTIARNMNDMTRRLNQLVPLLTTNRGTEVWDFDYHGLQLSLNQFSRQDSYIKALNGVVQHIKEKIKGFQAEGNLQWLEAVEWCIEHGLVQQGITQLQEGLLSWLCLYYDQKKWADEGYFSMYKNGKGRDLISTAVQFIGNPRPEEEWKGAIGRNPELGYRIMGDPLAQSLSKAYSSLSKIRNDINHGGYIKDHNDSTRKANQFYKELQSRYLEIRDILTPFQPAKSTGLLNLSNHPSDRWSEEQKTAAIDQYETVTDLPFPHIDPGMSNEQLEQLANEYFEKVIATQPTAVHLMGEMTFTHALVQKLKAAGIPCVASTSERLVTEKEDGEKVVRFRFVQFRAY